MGETGYYPSLPILKKIRSGTGPVRIYIDGDFLEKSLDQWVREAVAKVEEAGQK